MQNLPVLIFGIGGVGRSLLQQIMDQREFHAQEYSLKLDIIAVCDSSGAIAAEDGLQDTLLSDILAAKASGKRFADHEQGNAIKAPLQVVESMGVPNAVLVDCTASDATTAAMLLGQEKGYKLAFANKKPFTVDQEVYDRLTRAGITSDGVKSDGVKNDGGTKHLGPRVLDQARWETTVGAGLPVVATLNRLVASGDTVQRIAGAFSGTLGYVMTGLQEGGLLSEIVREAHRLGYTEPDPREDLGGVDVARKALILARGLGWQLNMDDVQVTGLYPPAMDSLSVDDFLDALAQEDAAFQTQVQDALTQNRVLRYAATIEDQQCRVGPVVVDSDSPLGRLTGTDNLAEFHTRWYSPNPLVIQGRGAGVEATAAGVLSDIIELS